MPQRDANDIGRITSTPGVQGGEPCIAGTRIQALIFAEFAVADAERALSNYPHLDRLDILACIAFAQGYAYARLRTKRKRWRKARKLVRLAESSEP